jgi:hypothetical protein
VPFEAHIGLLHLFLARRGDIVERIQGVLNGQRRPPDDLRNAIRIAREFEDGVFAGAATTAEQLRLRGGLEEAHHASGFTPRELPGLHNGLADPAEMMVRAFHLWGQTRWPGRNGRLRYAHTLFDLYIVRCLQLLSLRLWEQGAGEAETGLSQLQRLLDQLWTGTPSDRPILVRDARWLIPLAQSPATDDLAAYFSVSERVAATLPEPDRVAIHTAGAVMTGGHLRSQIRYHALKHGVPIDDGRVVSDTRSSNALDFSLLIQDLVPLLAAYEAACHRDDGRTRLELADAICQGVSPDPELFVNRVDLLTAYSMLEPLFLTDAGGPPTYTAIGRRHAELAEEYRMRIARVARPLLDDCRHFVPVPGAYSPYGVLYGFASNLLEHITLKTLQPGARAPFSLEDVFSAGGGEKLAWVAGWRQLPHLPAAIRAQFEYPQRFAEEMFARIERAFRRRVDGGDAAAPTGRLCVRTGGEAPGTGTARLPPGSVSSSDTRLVEAGVAEYCDQTRLLHDRGEGRCLVSYRTDGGWVAIRKTLLTDVLGAGLDAQLPALPSPAVAALQLMYPALVATVDDGRSASSA